MEYPSVGMSHSPGGSVPGDPGLFPTLGMGSKAELQLPGMWFVPAAASWRVVCRKSWHYPVEGAAAMVLAGAGASCLMAQPGGVWGHLVPNPILNV